MNNVSNVNNLAVFETSKYSPEQLLISALQEAGDIEHVCVVYKKKNSNMWYNSLGGETTALTLLMSSEMLRQRAMEYME